MNSERLPQKRRIREVQNINSTATMDDSLPAQKRFCNFNLNPLENRQRTGRRSSLNESISCSDNSFRMNNNNRNRSLMNGSRNLTQVPVDDTTFLAEHRCGKILSVHLINFMCHSNLRIDFDKRVNFLLGSNGSGKSAIMAALVLGLGSNARATSRSRSIKDFIRVGQNTAKIEITISNSGPEAYQPHLLSDQIVVVRTITHTSSTYSVKNGRTGVVVYRRSNELQQILLYHNIQVDNPVFVLNQDSSREFLKQLEPKKNYILFLKATQIDLVMEKLNECVVLHKSHVENLQIEEKNLHQMEKDLSGLKRDLDKLLSCDNLKLKIKKYESECAWLRVQQLEKENTEISGKLEKCEDEIKKLQNDLLTKMETIEHLKQQRKNTKLEIEQKKRDYLEENEKLLALKRKLNDAKELYENVNLKHKTLEKKMQRMKTELIEITKYIEEASKKDQSENDNQRRKNEETIARHRSRCNNDLKPIIEGCERDLNLFIENKSQKLLIIKKIEADRKNYNDNMRLLQHRINALKAGARDKICIYGNFMPQLLTDIKLAKEGGRFRELPVGPIGMYVELRADKYRDVIEEVLGFNLLNGFIVSHREDCQALEKLFKKYTDRIPQIITTRFTEQVYDVSRGAVKAPDGTICLLNEICCSHPMVMNVLIDCAGIESVLLTDSKDVAQGITMNEKSTPGNLSKVLVLLNGILMEFHPQPHFRMYSKRCSKSSFLQVNINERINDLEEEKNGVLKKLTSLEMDMKELHRQLPIDEKRIEEKRKTLQEQMLEMRLLEREIGELEATEYVDHNYEIILLKKEKEELQGQISALEKEQQDIAGDLEKSQRIVDEAQQDVTRKSNTFSVIMKEIQDLQAKEEIVEKEVNAHDYREANYNTKLNNLNKEKKILNEKLSSLQDALKVAVKKAEKLGDERIFTGRTEDQILLEIARCKAKLQYDTIQKYDQGTLTEMIAQKDHEFQEKTQIYENLKTCIFSLRRSLKYRFDFLKKFKVHMGMLMQMSFEMILGLRDFLGEMVIDHKEKTLEINIRPRNRKSLDADKKDVALQTLSGGERSYSTVAFLLSLWSCVDHPFYFLDEYDVYADEINREFMTRLLVEEGRKRPTSQYAFLTPQLVNIESEQNIKIHRLAKAT